jgi:phosphoribosyl-dephospho-CoA transferase
MSFEIQKEIITLKKKYNKIYDESKHALANHSSFYIKKQHNLQNLEKWINTEKGIKTYYNTKLNIIKKIIKNLEKKYKDTKFLDKDRLSAERELLSKKKLEKEKQEFMPRRSNRIANMKVSDF